MSGSVSCQLCNGVFGEAASDPIIQELLLTDHHYAIREVALDAVAMHDLFLKIRLLLRMRHDWFKAHSGKTQTAEHLTL